MTKVVLPLDHQLFEYMEVLHYLNTIIHRFARFPGKRARWPVVYSVRLPRKGIFPSSPAPLPGLPDDPATAGVGPAPPATEAAAPQGAPKALHGAHGAPTAPPQGELS